MSTTLQDYWKEAHSLQGSAFRQKEILQEIIDTFLTYEKVRSWTELSADAGRSG